MEIPKSLNPRLLPLRQCQSRLLAAIQRRHPIAQCRLVIQQAGNPPPIQQFRPQSIINGQSVFPVLFQLDRNRTSSRSISGGAGSNRKLNFSGCEYI